MQCRLKWRRIFSGSGSICEEGSLVWRMALGILGIAVCEKSDVKEAPTAVGYLGAGDNDSGGDTV